MSCKVELVEKNPLISYRQVKQVLKTCLMSF